MTRLLGWILLFTALAVSACSPAAPTDSVAAPTQSPGIEAPTLPPASSMATIPSTAIASDAPTQPVSNTVPVQVTLGDNWIKSDLTTFKVGVAYAFTVTNTGRREHNFNISHPAEKNPTAINAARTNALISISEDELQPGAVKTFVFTFKEAAPAGTLEFACLIPRHYIMGQHLAIVVEP